MAILKMKKLRLIAVRSKKKELLRELTKLGCVEFSEVGSDIREADGEELLRSEGSDILRFRSEHNSLTHAIALLNRYVPAKGKLLSAKPEFDVDAMLNGNGITAALNVANAIESADDRIKRISAEQSRQRAIAESMRPWLSFLMPLEKDGTERCSVVLGSFPIRTELNSVSERLAEVCEEAELFSVSDDKSQHYVYVICMREELPAVQECLRSCGFTPAAFSGLKGSARECLGRAEETLKALEKEKAACEELIVGEAVHCDEMKLAADKVNTRIFMAEAEDKLCGTDSTIVMEGWMPAESEEALEKVFEKYDCAWESRDPTEEEYPEVPVKLKNNKFTNALNMVTNMYSLPAYGTVDPNPLMAPFFILFYGLMMADMGYGLIMIAAALVAMRKMKPREGNLAFCQLLLYGGIATFLMGVLTGGLFSDIPYQLVHLFDPESTWPGLWHLFSPETDSEMVLYGSMVLGLLHLNTGMAVSFVQKTKHGDLAGAIWEEGSLWVILLGAVIWALGLEAVTGLAVLSTIGTAVLIVGAAMLLFGAGRNAKGFGKVTAALGCIYNTATGWFGDVLSYSRIMALMLAGGVVGKVFNTVAIMPAQSSGVNVVTMIAFVVIFLLGHTMNFALNLLGCFVHDLRLQCLEFFGKFYTDGGKPFRPLKFKGDYVEVKEN